MPSGKWSKTDLGFHGVPWPTGPDNSAITQTAFFNMICCGDGASASGHIWFIGKSGTADNTGANYLHDEDFTLATDVFWGRQCPANTAAVSVRLDHATQEVSWSLEPQAK